MERVIGEMGGVHPGPLVKLVGGLHGNEDKGVEALQHVIKEF